jgi:putative hydrolase of the HAD superfamily
MKYRHIFFDLDHTLWDFDTNAKATLTEVYQQFNLQEKIAEDFELFYRSYLYHNALLWDRYHKGFISSDELKWRRMWRTLLDFKIGDEKLAKDLSAEFLEILPTKKVLFEYTTEILEYLQQKNYVIHMITNGFENTQWKKINNSGLAKYFTKVITSECSCSIKPNKEIFRYALDTCGAELKESIMVGDNLDADIQGAINFGMDNVYVNHINATTPEIKPTYIITHLRELQTIL